MTLYAVELERQHRATVYVEADNVDDAKEAASELVTSDDFEEILDTFVDSASPVDTSRGNRYWTGGPNGEWVNP